jgi:hypothetical protein
VEWAQSSGSPTPEVKDRALLLAGHGVLVWLVDPRSGWGAYEYAVAGQGLGRGQRKALRGVLQYFLRPHLPPDTSERLLDAYGRRGWDGVLLELRDLAVEVAAAAAKGLRWYSPEEVPAQDQAAHAGREALEELPPLGRWSLRPAEEWRRDHAQVVGDLLRLVYLETMVFRALGWGLAECEHRDRHLFVRNWPNRRYCPRHSRTASQAKWRLKKAQQKWGR